MYGPSWSFQFKRGERYKLPTGYGFSAGNVLGGDYQYGEYEYVGPIEQKSRYEKYLVFREGESYVFCDPSASIMGDRLDISLNPRHFGALEKIIVEIGLCEWDTFVNDTDKKDYPALPGDKTE